MSMTSELLCAGLPDEFQSYLQSVMDLGFEETPNYEFYRQMFRQVAKKQGFDQKGVTPQFDWIILKEQRKKRKEERKKAKNAIYNEPDAAYIKQSVKQKLEESSPLKSDGKRIITQRFDINEVIHLEGEELIETFKEKMTR